MSLVAKHNKGKIVRIASEYPGTRYQPTPRDQKNESHYSTSLKTRHEDLPGSGEALLVSRNINENTSTFRLDKKLISPNLQGFKGLWHLSTTVTL